MVGIQDKAMVSSLYPHWAIKPFVCLVLGALVWDCRILYINSLSFTYNTLWISLTCRKKKGLTDQSHHRPDLLLSDIVLRSISKYILYYLKFRFRDETTDTRGKHIFPFLSKTSLIWSIQRMQLHHQIAPYLFCASISGVLQRFTALYIFSITLQQTVAKPGDGSWWFFHKLAWPCSRLWEHSSFRSTHYHTSCKGQQFSFPMCHLLQLLYLCIVFLQEKEGHKCSPPPRLRLYRNTLMSLWVHEFLKNLYPIKLVLFVQSISLHM